MNENMINNKNRQVFLDELPKKEGMGKYKNTMLIDWIESASQHCKVSFIYDYLVGEFEIIKYNKGKSSIMIKYNDKLYDNVSIHSFKKAHFDTLLGIRSGDFKIEIGTRFKDDKRDLTITNREYKKDKQGKTVKWHKYTCNICGWTGGWTREYSILKGYGCSCCNSDEIVLGINTIWDTDPWMIPIVGEECAKTHTHGSNEKVQVVCPDCGKIRDKKMRINDIHNLHKIPCLCGDGQPYTEKVMFKVLDQLGIDFEYHKTFEWSKNVKVDNPKLCGSKEYDFYIEDLNCIIETHGEQHYKDKKRSHARNLEENKLNDKLKKELAIFNNIKEENYIIIDCRKSELEWIKQNIINSRLNELYDLSQIDWMKVEEFALSNRVKEACNYKKNNLNLNTTQIGALMNLYRSTISRYLKLGNELGWCHYDADEEQLKGRKNKSKPVIYFKDGQVFSSAKELSIKSFGIYEIELKSQNITWACRNKNKHGYARYIEDLTPEEYIRYDIENKLKELRKG